MTNVTLITIIILVIILFIWLVLIYNALVRLRNQVDNSWAQIDVQLKRRTNLIPNLIETVKGYAKHEREVFENVTKARSSLMSAGPNPKDVAKADNMLTGALKSLFAVAEAYPDLKANQNFMQLQEELTATENKVAFSRQYFNDMVMIYNTKIQSVPPKFIASMFNFTRKELFEIPEAEKVVPKVSF